LTVVPAVQNSSINSNSFNVVIKIMIRLRLGADAQNSATPPLALVPSLYFSEGIPYVIVMTLSGCHVQTPGHFQHRHRLLHIGSLPWFQAALEPVGGHHRTKRFWIVAMQFLCGGLAWRRLPLIRGGFFKWSLVFWNDGLCVRPLMTIRRRFYMLV